MRPILLAILLLLCCTITSAADCPTDSKDLLINTQEKYDNIYLQYPNCNEFSIVMMNGKFIGDPRPAEYALLLSGMILGILLAIKVLFKYMSWFSRS